MSEAKGRQVPNWFWIVAILAMLWEAVGCYFYLMQVRMGPAELSALPKAQADAFAGMATWQWSVFAIAVWSGLAGAVALLARSRWAIPLLAVSLIAAIIQYGYTFAATPILSTMPVAEAVPLPAAVIVIGALLVWFASSARRKGWLR